MGSGKSTAIQVLREISKIEIENIKFAGPLYAMQEAIYKIVEPVHKRPDSFVKDRLLLQWLGTDWGRNSVKKDIWTALWEAAVREKSNNLLVVCDDVRFENEIDAIHKLGGVVVQLISPNSEVRAVQGGIVNHASECILPAHLVDFTVKNDATLEVFRNRLIDLFVNELDVETK